MSHYILVEGSSSAAGYSDEQGKGGFIGRLENHFREYSQEFKRRNGWNSVKQWVYVHNYARVGNMPTQWAQEFPYHAQEVARFSGRSSVPRQHMLGMLVLESHPLGIAEYYGPELHNSWLGALASMEMVFSDYHGILQPMVIQMPLPERFVSQRGREIHTDLARLARKSADSMEAHYIDISEIPTLDRTKHVAEDGMHPSAAGHQVIFDYLLPIIYQKLQLEPLSEESP